MPDKLQNDPINTGWRNQLIFGFILLMMISLLFSRALLSISMAGFILLAVLQQDVRKLFHRYITNPLLWGMSLLFFVPFLSGLWSADKQTLLEVVRVKLPLFLLPFAFAGNWKLNKFQWSCIVAVFLLTVLAGTAWSVVHYLNDRAAIDAAYLEAKTMPVPLQGDHVRFSWMVAIAVIVAVAAITEITGGRKKTVLLFLTAWFIVFLHILAARTGLFACYLFLAAFFIYSLFRSRKKSLAFIIILAGILIPAAAWFFFPTFQNRFKYLRYNFDFVKNSSYLPGATDGGRLFSFKAGWQILKENPLGTGAGDLRQVANKWYDENIPGIADSDRIYPSNEWLLYGGFAGWPGVLLMTIAVGIPFFISFSKQKFFWRCFHATAILSFMVDTGLEVQYGVFIYCFATCGWWKWQQVQKQQLFAVPV